MRLHNSRGLLLRIAACDQLLRSAAMLTLIENALRTASFCLTGPHVQECLQETSVAFPAFLSASHLLLYNGISFVCKGLRVSWKADSTAKISPQLRSRHKAARLQVCGIGSGFVNISSTKFLGNISMNTILT